MIKLTLPDQRHVEATPALVYEVEASDLGWPPGHWPPSFAVTVQVNGSSNPEEDFVRLSEEFRDGELAAVFYRNRRPGSRVIRVEND